MSALADRGKETEKQVKLFLDRFNNEHARFDYERLPDARSSRGRIAAQVADFAFFTPDCHGVIEAKETEHDFRLTRAKISQLPKIRKRILAGGNCIVIVFHSQIKKWRMPDVEYLLETDGASWDISPFPTYDTAEDALRTNPTFARRAK